MISFSAENMSVPWMAYAGLNVDISYAQQPTTHIMDLFEVSSLISCYNKN